MRRFFSRPTITALFVLIVATRFAAFGTEPSSVRVPSVSSTDREPETDADKISRLSSIGIQGDPLQDCPPVCCDESGLFDNLSLLLGLEGSKQPQDFGVNAQFGGRFSVNWGIPLFEEHGIGVQAGTSINYTDNAVQVYERINEVTGRSQSFTTVGVFQRTDRGLVWGAAYDFLFQQYYDDFHLGQWRAKVGWQFDDANEAGIRFAIPERDDRGTIFVFPVTLEPIGQGSVYWRHTWESCAETTIWLGIAEGFGQRNLAFEALFLDTPAQPADERFVFGAEIHVPLNDHLAIFGQGNFITPAYTGTVDSYLGLVYYPGGGAKRARQRQFAPVLPVSNSTSFSVDLR